MLSNHSKSQDKSERATITIDQENYRLVMYIAIALTIVRFPQILAANDSRQPLNPHHMKESGDRQWLFRFLSAMKA